MDNIHCHSQMPRVSVWKFDHYLEYSTAYFLCYNYFSFFAESECFLVVAHCKSLEDPSTPVINLDYKGPCEKRLTNESRLVGIVTVPNYHL